MASPRLAEMMRMYRLWPFFVALLAVSACTPAPAVVDVAPSNAPFSRAIELTINFDFDSARIRPDSYAALDNLAAAMLSPALSGAQFEVNGHTDLTGTLGYNIALSMLRARSVLAYLAARGVPRELMHPQGFGPLQLINSVDPFDPANRRVEIVAYRN